MRGRNCVKWITATTARLRSNDKNAGTKELEPADCLSGRREGNGQALSFRSRNEIPLTTVRYLRGGEGGINSGLHPLVDRIVVLPVREVVSKLDVILAVLLAHVGVDHLVYGRFIRIRAFPAAREF